MSGSEPLVFNSAGKEGEKERGHRLGAFECVPRSTKMVLQLLRLWMSEDHWPLARTGAGTAKWKVQFFSFSLFPLSFLAVCLSAWFAPFHWEKKNCWPMVCFGGLVECNHNNGGKGTSVRSLTSTFHLIWAHNHYCCCLIIRSSFSQPLFSPILLFAAQCLPSLSFSSNVFNVISFVVLHCCCWSGWNFVEQLNT